MRQINLDRFKDNYNFQLVAYLVDREDFLKDIQSAREDLKTLIRYEDVEKYLKKLGEEAKEKGQKLKFLDCSLPDGTDASVFTNPEFQETVKWLVSSRR